MTFSRFTNRVRPIIVLEQDSYECATLKGGPAKPAVKDIEDSKQPRGRRARTAFNALLQPSSSPQFLASPKEGKHELLFRRVVQIERPLRYAGTGDNGVYPHSANAVARKKLISRGVDAVACGRRLKRLGLSRTTHKHTINGRQICLPRVRAARISVDIDHRHASRALPRSPARRPISIRGPILQLKHATEVWRFRGCAVELHLQRTRATPGLRVRRPACSWARPEIELGLPKPCLFFGRVQVRETAFPELLP